METTEAIIVKLKPGGKAEQAFGGQPYRALSGTSDQFVLSFPGASSVTILAETRGLMERNEVLWAEPDFLTEFVKHSERPISPWFEQQWNLENTGQFGGKPGADIQAVPAWDLSQGKGVVVAVYDEGVEPHPDLTGNLFTNPGEIPDNGIDDDHNGYIDDVSGWNFVQGNANPAPEESHGETIAGIIAANNPITGAMGIAPEAMILPIRVFLSSTSAKAEALYYAAGRTQDGQGRWRGADIINISLEFPASAAFDEAVTWAVNHGRNEKGCLIFASSGNDAALWEQTTITEILAGRHTFEWRYVKDSSKSAGLDAAFLDGVVFPGGEIENFQTDALPPGWTTGGSAAWHSVGVTDGQPGLVGWNGRAGRSVRSGTIGNNQFTWLKVTKAVPAGNLSFFTWISCESSWTRWFDHLEFYYDSQLRDAYDRPDALYPMTSIGYPASAPNVIAVGASTDFDFRSDTSQYGPELQFVAPSNGGRAWIAGIDLIGAAGYNTNSDVSGNYYDGFGGTSASAPQAAGVAALILGADPTLTGQQVLACMRASADKVGDIPYNSDGWNQEYGYGRINAYAAVTNALSPPHTPVARDDSVSARPNLSAKISIPKLMANDYDLDGHPLEFVWNDFPLSSAKNARIVVSKDLGQLLYNSDNALLNPTGLDTFHYRVQDGHGGTNQATVYVKLSYPPSVGPNVLATIKNNDGTITLKFLGITGHYYRVQGTADLHSSWTDLTLVDDNASGVFTNRFLCANNVIAVNDPSLNSHPQCFYRSVLVP